MAFRKYQSVERVDPLTPQQHKQIEGNLERLGKTSAADLTADERALVIPDENGIAGSDQS